MSLSGVQLTGSPGSPGSPELQEGTPYWHRIFRKNIADDLENDYMDVFLYTFSTLYFMWSLEICSSLNLSMEKEFPSAGVLVITTLQFFLFFCFYIFLINFGKPNDLQSIQGKLDMD